MQISDKKSYRELAEKIESGEYFLEARDWYLRKYVFNFIERSYVLLLIIFIIAMLAISIFYYSSILPIKKSLPVKVNISSAADYSTRITYLGNSEKNFDINLVYIKYFSGRFIEAIESYDSKGDFKKLKANRNIIETLATNDILSYYIDRISIRNPDSITLKYRKKITRSISLDQTKYDIAEIKDESGYYIEKTKDGQEIKRYSVVYNFEATEFDKETGVSSKSNWQAKIILSFQTIKYNYDEKDFTPLNFKVISYESKRIS